MTIIEATIDDIHLLEPLVNQAYRGGEAAGGWTNEAHLISGPRTSAFDLGECFRDGVILKGVNDSGEIMGCVYLEQRGDTLYLGMLSVWPREQGAGIGKQFLAFAAARALALGCKAIRISVISVRSELIAWYERHGYVRTGEMEPFHAGERFGSMKVPLELVVLEKPVD